MSMERERKVKGVSNSAQTIGRSSSGVDFTDCSKKNEIKSSHSENLLPSAVEPLPCERDNNVDLRKQLLHLEDDLKCSNEENRKLKKLVDQLKEQQRKMELIESEDVTIQKIYDAVVGQQKEIVELTELCERQKSKMNVLKKAVESGRCAQCALRNLSSSATAAATNDYDYESLPYGVECTSQSDGGVDDSKPQYERVILLNDGRTFSLSMFRAAAHTSQFYEDLPSKKTSLTNDVGKTFGALSSSTSSSSSSSSAVRWANTAFGAEPRSDDTLAPSSREDFAFQIEQQNEQPRVQAAGASVQMSDRWTKGTISHVCPMCDQADFESSQQLTAHVHMVHFPDDDTVG